MAVISTDEKLPIANGGTNATTKGGAVANLLAETVTLANCSNTSTETTVMSVTIPANTWADGEEVGISVIARHKQNSGGSIAITYKVKVNASSLTTLSASSVSNSATEGKTRRSFFFTRVGSDIYYTGNGNTYGDMSSTASVFGAVISAADYYGSGNGNIYTSVDFTSSVTLTFTVQWASANANAYWIPLWGKCRKQ